MNPIVKWDYENQCWTFHLDEETFDELWEALSDTERGEYWPECEKLLEAFFQAAKVKQAVDSLPGV